MGTKIIKMLIKKKFSRKNIWSIAIKQFVLTFAVLKVDELDHLAGQAVNLLNCLLGFFYAR